MAGAERRRVVAVDVGYADFAQERAVLAACGAELTEAVCGGDPAAIAAAVAEADAVLVREAPLPRAAIDGMRRCRGIVRYGVGVDNIDLAAAAGRRIYVANVPDYGVEEVSDHALALLLAVARRIAARDRAVRDGAWNVGAREPMHRLAGRVLGLVGYGRIARAFHRKAAGLGFGAALVFDPGLAMPPEGATLVSLERLCREADVISLHAPLTAETRHLLGRARLALLKPTAILVNTARGGLIDEAALVEALQAGRLFGAGLDVFETEPPPPDHPLFRLANVVVTDHTGWYSEDSVTDLQRKAAEEVARILRGESPRCWVNRWPE